MYLRSFFLDAEFVAGIAYLSIDCFDDNGVIAAPLGISWDIPPESTLIHDAQSFDQRRQRGPFFEKYAQSLVNILADPLDCPSLPCTPGFV